MMTMPRFRSFLCLIALPLFTHGLLAQFSADSLIRRAWYIQDQRRDVDGSLAELLVNRSPRVRAAGFRAVANLRDTAWIPSILQGLGDRQPSVRTMAAFAAGQSADHSFVSTLIHLASIERIDDVQNALLDALGRVGTDSDLDSLVDRWTREKGRHRLSALSAMMRFSIRNIRSTRAMWYAIECLSDRDPEVRWRAMYALGRWAPHPSLNTELSSRSDLFAARTLDRSADVRLNSAILLGKIDSELAREMLTRFSIREGKRADSDWRVRVQIVRAAATQMRKDGSMIPILLQGLQDKNDHVVIAAAMALPADAPIFQTLTGRDSLRTVLWNLLDAGNSRAPLVAGEAIVGLVRFFPEELPRVLARWKGQDLSTRFVTKYLEAVSQAPSIEGWEVMKASWDDVRAVVAMAAWDNSRRFFRSPLLRSLAPDDAASKAVTRSLYEGLSRALSRRDMGISTVASTLLGDTNIVALLDSAGHRGAITDSLVLAVDGMRVPDDVETLQAALQALGVLGGPSARGAIERQFASSDRSVVESAISAWTKLTGSPPTGVTLGDATPKHMDYDWDLIRSIQARPTVEMKTDRGTVVIELLPDEAPFTALSFVRLARGGYFNGLTFHRVVPNFVVQGGDPRGDGWGGPGYALRTESTPRPYERGAVGMASAGFDTEGSQFFITHVATPHLNARYTIFARVTAGMDVVDQLQVGDTIREVKVRAPETQRGVRSR